MSVELGLLGTVSKPGVFGLFMRFRNREQRHFGRHLQRLSRAFQVCQLPGFMLNNPIPPPDLWDLVSGLKWWTTDCFDLKIQTPQALFMARTLLVLLEKLSETPSQMPNFNLTITIPSSAVPGLPLPW